MILLYNIFLQIYTAALHLAANWNPKARQWVQGRQNWKSHLQSKLNLWQSPDAVSGTAGNHESVRRTPKIVWMHCASLGEFEQGRPLLETLRKTNPHHKIVLTFFSPSGYEIRKDYSGADHVMYLPMDGAANAAAFVDMVQPSLVLWVKYEYWHYYLTALKKGSIPVLLVSGIFRPTQPFFQWYGKFWKHMLDCFLQLFVQTLASRQLLETIGKSHICTVTGDTRFDRVIDVAANHTPLSAQLKAFCEGHQVLVAGSTWEEDEEELVHYTRVYPQIKFIIAPHEVSEERIRELKQAFPQALLYSAIITEPFVEKDGSNVLIIDNIGSLARLYKYATIAYVGGGFNQSGIHNILEAAVYGKAVVFGPVYEKFAEATDLVDAGGAFSIENALELEALLNRLLNNKEELMAAEKIAKDYVHQHRGATEKIMEYIYTNRLLTS